MGIVFFSRVFAEVALCFCSRKCAQRNNRVGVFYGMAICVSAHTSLWFFTAFLLVFRLVSVTVSYAELGGLSMQPQDVEGILLDLRQNLPLEIVQDNRRKMRTYLDELAVKQQATLEEIAQFEDAFLGYDQKEIDTCCIRQFRFSVDTPQA